MSKDIMESPRKCSIALLARVCYGSWVGPHKRILSGERHCKLGEAYGNVDFKLNICRVCSLSP